MQGDKGLGQALVIAHEPPEARGPGKAALDNPAPRQQDKAVLGLGVFTTISRILCASAWSAAA